MRLLASRLLLLALALFAVVPATAGAATTPKVTSISPLNLKIGQRLTIKGTGFLPGKNRNTVVFKASGQRAVFVKAVSATKTKLVVTVPAKLAPFLKVRSGVAVGTRFQLRVLAKKLSRTYTPKGASPTIAPATAPVATAPVGAKKPGGTSVASVVPATPAAAAPSVPAAPAPAAPANCDGDAQIDSVDADDDNDLLTDVLERQIGTAVCGADTDGDSMSDGWEYRSALDLNRESCPAAQYPTACAAARPYPTKRPYVNPLWADADKDYDGDYLPAGIEYRMWKSHVPNSITDMWYSDGLQASQDTAAQTTCRGLDEDDATGQVDKYPSDRWAVPSPVEGSYQAPQTLRWRWLYGRSDYTLDTDPVGHPNRGCLSDDERDEDGDFLSNGDEFNRMMTGPEYVLAVFEEPAFKTTYIGTDPLDPDTDGDDIVDGMDDQDFDDFWNVEEIKRGAESSVEVQVPDDSDPDTEPEEPTTADTGKRWGLWVDPYNPCLPAIYSRTCPRGVLINETPWRPFYRGEAPLRRWPLYHTSQFNGTIAVLGLGDTRELWSMVPEAEQKLPPQQPGDPDATGVEHPLPRPAAP
jgi:hypothetical protein